MMKASDLSFVSSKVARDRILAELRENGIQRWPDLAGRQVPAKVITRYRGCGQGTTEAFARFVRQHGGCVTVDIPPDWKIPVPEVNDWTTTVQNQR